MLVSRSENKKGFTLIEIIISVGIFMLFALGIYSCIVFVSKIVYLSRMTILETAVMSEEMEVVRNLPYASIGTVGGSVPGVLQPLKSVMRDGASFTITTTVRYVDDPFDGVAGGSPNDTSPADFKLVEMTAICAPCNQQVPAVLSTRIGPKGLEGSSLNGSLFINVFDEAGQPVPGATVRVINNSINPAMDYTDITGNDGYLRLVDIPTSTMGYRINVTKANFSTDYTTGTSAAIPAPVKPPANVASQQVTDLSFSIDELANVSLHTINQACVGVGSVGFNMRGAKLLGTGPNYAKYSVTTTSDGSGNKNFSSIEWDTYDINLSGNTYDIAGSIPLLPFYLVPGSNQDVSLILKAHSSNSLLVQVEDAATGLPLSSTTARLVGSGYDTSYLTGLGYIRQTDWSGGSGAASFVEGRYYADDTNISATVSPGDVKLKKSGSTYRASGNLESGTFDFGTQVTFNNIIITPTTQPAQTGSQSVRLQIATSNSSTPSSWTYLGPNGTAATYYTVTNTLVAATSSGKRYMRYKLFLTTANTAYTPTFSEIAFTYTDACVPPGQAYFDSLSSGTYTLYLSATGYSDASTTIDVSGYTRVRMPMATP